MRYAATASSAAAATHATGSPVVGRRAPAAEVREAVLTVLLEESEPLHWTVIQDLALRRGYVNPFVTPDVRRLILAELAAATREGVIVKAATGVYSLP